MDLVLGNHDIGLANLAPSGTEVIPAAGYVLDGIGYFHGHTWPDKALFKAEALAAGHLHPAVRLRQPVGVSWSERVWARSPLLQEIIERQYGEALPAPEMILVPAFNDLCGGLPLNEPLDDERGPILAMADLDRSRIYMTDGSDLGTLGGIKAAQRKL